jgi:type I restriction enzyme S subunit
MTAKRQSLAGFGEVPAEWDVRLFPEVVYFQEGPGLGNSQWTTEGMKAINVKNILLDGTLDPTNSSRFISVSEFARKYRHFAIDAGDIVVSSSGWSYGKVARVKAEHLPLMMNTSVIRFRPLSEAQLDANFLFYFLRSDGFLNQVRSFIIGVQQPNFGPSHVKRMLIPVPPINLQQQIGSILSAYDELMENSQRRIRLLEAIARSLYREWFVDFRFPCCEKLPRVASPLGDIPQGWEAKRVPECVDISPHVVVPRDGQKPFVPMGCLSNDSMLISDIESREGNSGAKFQNGDTLFARITPCLENGKTGFVQFLPDAQAVGFGSTEFIVLRSRTLTPEFAYLLARSDEFRGVAIKSMSGATGRQRVQEQCFDDFRIAQPPRALLDRFSAIVAPSFRLIYKLHQQIENLRRTRDLLLPRLLSGQVNLVGN